MNEKEIAVLFAAGKGSRLLPLTEQIPKPLIKVKGKPMIETLIEAYQQHGIKEIHIVLGYKNEQFAYLTQKYQHDFLTENTE
ncbi:MAG: NTP transferase domain-containing protein, partial [Firmicutes bacterium]|nr:NTP transferase domain-containing protein [Bacillota bacterium]